MSIRVLLSSIAANVALAAMPPYAQAQSSLASCRSIADDSARLRCYDRIADAQAERGISGADRALASPGAPHGSAGSTSAASSQRPASSAADSEAFGFKRRLPDQLQDLRSSIPGRFTGWQSGTRFRLANGQLWEVTDKSRAAYWLSDPQVRITRGALGSYFLEVEGVAASPRVRRVE